MFLPLHIEGQVQWQIPKLAWWIKLGKHSFLIIAFCLKTSAADFLTFPSLIELYRSHNKVQSSISFSANLFIIHWTLEPNCPSHLSRRIVLLFCSLKKKRTRQAVKFIIFNGSPFSSAALTVVEKQKQEQRESPFSLKLFLCFSNTIRANSVDQPFNMQNGRRYPIFFSNKLNTE